MTLALEPWIAWWTRPRVHRLSRAVIVLLLAVGLGSYFVTPVGPLGWAADILLRTYLMFLCTVMAHEGSHNHLGATRASNDVWGRLALLLVLVPYISFRKTHRMHHACTNLPEQDPDHFVKPNHWWEIPLRSVAVPHYWLFWLARRGWIERRDVVDLIATYLAFGAVFGAVAWGVGLPRLILGTLPAQLLVSLLLWYPFAVKTHEGYSVGAPEERSHDYYGLGMYWFSLGLSMHRIHHLSPRLAWIQMLPFVKPAPAGRRFRPTRHVVAPAERSEERAAA